MTWVDVALIACLVVAAGALAALFVPAPEESVAFGPREKWGPAPTRLDAFHFRGRQLPESPEVRDQADADEVAALALVASPVDDDAWCAGHGIDWQGVAR